MVNIGFFKIKVNSIIKIKLYGVYVVETERPKELKSYRTTEHETP